MIGLVDIDFGNRGKLKDALDHIGCPFRSVKSQADLSELNGLILPGVGSFGGLSEALHANEIFNPILSKLKWYAHTWNMRWASGPFKKSDESPSQVGFSLISGEVKAILRDANPICWILSFKRLPRCKI